MDCKIKYTETDFALLTESFLPQLYAPRKCLWNLSLTLDQMGLNTVLFSTRTMDKKEVGRVELTGMKDKRHVMAVLCVSLVRDFLPLQLSREDRMVPLNSHMSKHWSNEETMLEYI